MHYYVKNNTSTSATWTGWNTCPSSFYATTTWNGWNATITYTTPTWTTSATSTTTTTAIWTGWNVCREEVRRYRQPPVYRAPDRIPPAPPLITAADERADKLLVECLSAAQRDSLTRLGYFDVEVRGKTYRIKRGTHGNVEEIVDGKPKRRFCIQPDGVPRGDAMLSQKLFLEADEAAFLRIANRTELS